jgi:glucokinase
VKNNKILRYEKKITPKNKIRLIKELIKNIENLMSKDTKGIGIASPGPLKDGIIKNPPNLPLKNYNLKKVLEKRFKVRVEIENDANCVALAESKFGCKKKNFIVLTLGTGIGGGIIINGKLYKGKGYGGELGHIILDKGECFEDLGAWKKASKLTKKYFGKDIWLNELIKMKNPKARKILQELNKYLGQGIASLINVFDPEVVILGGGMKAGGEKFLNMIKKEVKRYVLLPKTTPIRWTKLKHPGILGASRLIK